uniref:Uncharacterized protein n=1 Tax=Candidatus Kentrum sp. SD TaxID=2126332 RepID=A0A450YJA6_9GAMM|nr:MAG: hypothetical protein BECKSD772F_GA0070984_10966 [Candidatus Kentron sp. SD]VFK47534.1 MAG: hypothetical protein BECKSD772E_GA0070983_10976 [Candidatus Kentron sp. SD]
MRIRITRPAKRIGSDGDERMKYNGLARKSEGFLVRFMRVETNYSVVYADISNSSQPLRSQS